MKVTVMNIIQSEEKLELSKKLVQKGEFEKAESMLKKAIKLNPKNEETYFWLYLFEACRV